MKAVFRQKQDIAQNIISFDFKPERPLNYTAGQYTNWTLSHQDADERGESRWFTLSSSPTEELITLTTKFNPKGSSFKKTLLSLKPGDRIDIENSEGNFILPPKTDRPIIFVAGGIGVTPYRSIVKYCLDQNLSYPIHLIYAANVAQDFAFQDLFAQAPIKTTYLVKEAAADWEGSVGILSANKIIELDKNAKQALVYISGPELMVEAIEQQLKEAGFNESQLKTDFFPNYPDY